MTNRHSERYGDDWEGAVCAQIGAEVADSMFFPLGPDQGAMAVKLCWDCPIRARCLTVALEEERGTPARDRFGIRGGLSGHQRADLDPGKICADCGSPIITRSEHCDDDRDVHRLKHRREYERERRRDAA
ncbi:MAG: WhiB family transcriptional regulator [Brachybacterium sp.]|uniref:WhiB family transcriptional regulator n=1 Tax=Brachybacterium sp. TaxID=1891286 RepID=UPI0026488185|nr:WhiB family transcriptional regulator [Brachybacterium sp.]MDN5688546.1 WhiB family transcriptional regulator [Brachybacterium sp.]